VARPCRLDALANLWRTETTGEEVFTKAGGQHSYALLSRTTIAAHILSACSQTLPQTRLLLGRGHQLRGLGSSALLLRCPCLHLDPSGLEAPLPLALGDSGR
jgi:hypothetical protein